MQNINLPSDQELKNLSATKLNHSIEIAFQEWVETKRCGGDTTEISQIFRAFDCERLNRLRQIQAYLK